MVTLKEEEQKRVALHFLYKLYNWKENYEIIDLKVHESKVCNHHSTNWIEHEYIRDATDDDYVIASLLLKIKEEK